MSCSQCDYYRAATNGYQARCPRHAWEEMQRVERRDGNLDAYYADQRAIYDAREAQLRKERGR